MSSAPAKDDPLGALEVLNIDLAKREANARSAIFSPNPRRFLAVEGSPQDGVPTVPSDTTLVELRRQRGRLAARVRIPTVQDATVHVGGADIVRNDAVIHMRSHVSMAPPSNSPRQAAYRWRIEIPSAGVDALRDVDSRAL